MVWSCIHRNKFHRNAELILNKIISSVSTGQDYPGFNIEIKYGAKAKDFSQDYKELMRDYTFGSWEFILEFSNGSRYYFDFYEYKGDVTASVKPLN